MRIIAGRYGGRRLSVPKGRDIRPTSDKVRGAIFNTLGGMLDLEDVNVLDVFCGTGALGLEALSRGAVQITFIDKHKASLGLARENAQCLDVMEQCRFQLGDAKTVQLNQEFDLIFLDPPYAQDLVVPVLNNLIARDVLKTGSICVIETEKHASLDLNDCFEVLKAKEYGDTLVTYLRYR